MSHSAAPSSLPQLRIAVVGVGGIGSTFAFQMARTGGHEVTVAARAGSERWKQLERDGSIVNAKGERAEVRVTDKLDEAVPYDLVLVTLQSQQVQALLPALQRSAALRIQFMCNTFDPERLRDAVGPERCSFGMPFVQATVSREGVLHAKIGVGGQKCKMDDERSVEVFQAAGLPAVFEPRMLLWLRCHAPLGAAFESVSVAGERRGGGASWSDAMRIARGLKESFRLIERLGYKVYPSGKQRLHASPAAISAGMLWFMSRIPSFRRLLATGINECRGLVEDLVAATSNAVPPVSVATIRGMEP